MKTYFNQDILNNVEVSIETITPIQATEYISHNYDYNRKIAEPKVNDLSTEMNMGRFYLGDSAICFNEEGALVNGQHRLNALIKSDTTQVFIVARNMPEVSLKIMDIGAKRDTADRVTLSGVPITRREQAVIKNAMTPFNSGIMGVQKFNHNRYDSQIANYFTRTKYFFDCCNNERILSSGQKYKTFIVCAALKIFLQMKKDNKEYAHGMSAIDRAFHFMYVTCNQTSVKQAINLEYDKSALALKQRMEQFKENTHGSFWTTPECYRKTMNLAYNFMLGNPVQVMKAVKHDRFTDFAKLVDCYCISNYLG